MKSISVEELKQIIQTEKGNSNVDFINVCTPAEYAEKHISGVRNVPLADISNHISELKDKRVVYVHCRSGNRSAKAIELLSSLGVQAELVNVAGGLIAWGEAGFPTTSTTTRLPIMRQTFIAAGILILVGTLSAIALDPRFLIVPLIVGSGLTFAGITGWCGMSYALAKMPWNRA